MTPQKGTDEEVCECKISKAQVLHDSFHHHSGVPSVWASLQPNLRRGWIALASGKKVPASAHPAPEGGGITFAPPPKPKGRGRPPKSLHRVVADPTATDSA